ncbi:MAG: isochorismatase family protein [Bacteroidales bacterium]|nr:isochorismatase family protein [Bacteroidales bacterium]
MRKRLFSLSVLLLAAIGVSANALGDGAVACSKPSSRPTLIVVDCQNDFSREGAPLFVPGGNAAIEAIVRLMDSGNIGHVVFTVDWHPANHSSFKPYGGIWPPHCVQHTEGAAIRTELIEACGRNGLTYSVFEKGANPNEEEYGAFAGTWSETEEAHVVHHAMGDFALPKGKSYILCGIAGDYCVKETLKNVAHLRPQVFMPGVAHIGAEQTLLDEMSALGIKPYRTK